MYGIRRIDDDAHKTHCWEVAITRRWVQYYKHFSDGVYGGKQIAFNAAKEYRDSIISKHPHYKKKYFCSRVRRNNKSGIPGVGKYANKRINGKLSWFWLAYWVDDKGTRKNRKFLINKYGEEEAYDRAVKVRKEMLSKMNGAWRK